MIELGLGRISRLLKDISIPWRAIHVAGTNGKGSVCSYASAMLKAGDVKCGRFTSPHLIDRWDCITIDEKVIDQDLFRHVENAVKSRDDRDNIQASEFELLTATAFEVFNREKVEVGVVEVGLGGRYDATNVLQDPLVTVITKIGKDHQSFLGNSLEEIAYQKAGIMKQNVPCIVDGSNAASVMNVVAESAKASQAASLLLVSQETWSKSENLQSFLNQKELEAHQQINISLAYEAVKIAMACLRPSLQPRQLLSAIPSVIWPGRLQALDLSPVIGQTRKVLLDGAHNVQSAQVLGSYVDRKLRSDDHPVTWIIAVSHGKEIQEILSYLLKPGDNVIAAAFGPVEGMPWVHPTDIEVIRIAASAVGRMKNVVKGSGSLEDTVRQAVEMAAGAPMVICGSLYLVSDVLRMLRDVEQSWKKINT